MDKKLLSALAVVAGMAVSVTAQATPINGTGNNGETTLQQILNDITTDGSSSVNVNTDQFTPDSHWSVQASGGSVTQMIIEITANDEFNSFGIYDVTDHTNTYELFDGGDTPTAGGKRTFGFQLDGTIVDGDDNPLGAQFAGNLFGYYLNTPNGTFYSDSSLNADSGADHQVAFRGGQGDEIQIGNSAPGLFGGDEFIFAWEDSLSSNWDYDYNDFVVLAESIDPVPEPSMLALFGFSLVGLGFMARRRKFH